MATNKFLGTYSPESVHIVISNNSFSHIISGYADGTFINLTRVVDHATLYTGADGSNARVKRSVRNFDVTLTLNQAAESNDVLSQLLRLDEDSPRGEWTFSLTLKDASGRTVASANEAFIGTSPDLSLGTDIAEHDWVLHAVDMDIFIGGNGRLLQTTADTLVDLGYNPDPYWVSDVA